MNKLTEIMLIQHEIINRIMKYDKEIKPKQYNETIKKQIKALLKLERKKINDLF